MGDVRVAPLSLSLLLREVGEGESQSPTLALIVGAVDREGVEAELLRLLVDTDEESMLLVDLCAPTCVTRALSSDNSS